MPFFVADAFRRLSDDQILELIRAEVSQRVYQCPIRLFDTLTKRVITREELAEQLVEAMAKHVSTHPTAEVYVPSPSPSPSSSSSSSEFVEDASAGRDEVTVDEIERASLPPKWEDLKAALDHNSKKSGSGFYRPTDLPGLIDQLCRYAILSHRWSTNELLFSDTSSLRRTRDRNTLKTRKPQGYQKFASFVRVVKDRDPLCRYLWLDTFCINKDSSAELDESIRSMFSWYEKSHVCIVHLAQTQSSDQLADDPWFKRGWTLQELLAPHRIKFYGTDWSPVFPKMVLDVDRQMTSSHTHDQSRRKLKASQKIAEAAGIDAEYLKQHFTPTPDLAPLVFSWASRRQTSRPEDIAYSLIGLLKVHLPIAYGEGGASAFGRLQAACIQSSPSRGLFWWTPWNNITESGGNSMLASTMHAFKSPTCHIHCHTVAGFDNNNYTFSLANGVLLITMWLLQVHHPTIGNGCIRGTLFNPNDVEIESLYFSLFEDRKNFEKGTLVVGVLGFDSTDQMRAVTLSKKSGYWVRDSFLIPTRLPSKSDFECSGVKPQQILIR